MKNRRNISLGNINGILQPTKALYTIIHTYTHEKEAESKHHCRRGNAQESKDKAAPLRRKTEYLI